MASIISFRDAEVVTRNLGVRIETLEKKVAKSNVTIDTANFITQDNLRSELNKLFTGFIHTIEIALDSVREGAGITHFKQHIFKGITLFENYIIAAADILPFSDNTLSLGSTSFYWGPCYLGSLDVKGSITIFADNGGDLGSAAKSFSTLYCYGAQIKGISVASRPARFGASKELISGLIDISSATDVTGTLPINFGGTGDVTPAGARTNLDVYSIADVDALIAGLQAQINTKATGGVQTGVTGGHTHTQLI